MILEHYWALVFGVAMEEWLGYHAIVSSLRVRGKKYKWDVNYFQYAKMRWWKVQRMAATEKCGCCFPGMLAKKSEWPSEDGFNLPAGSLGAGNALANKLHKQNMKQQFVMFHVEMGWLKVSALLLFLLFVHLLTGEPPTPSLPLSPARHPLRSTSTPAFFLRMNSVPKAGSPTWTKTASVSSLLCRRSTGACITIGSAPTSASTA